MIALKSCLEVRHAIEFGSQQPSSPSSRNPDNWARTVPCLKAWSSDNPLLVGQVQWDLQEACGDPCWSRCQVSTGRIPWPLLWDQPVKLFFAVVNGAEGSEQQQVPWLSQGCPPFWSHHKPNISSIIESIPSVCNAKMCRQDWKKNFTKKENCSLRISRCTMRQDCTPGGTHYTLFGCILQSDIWVAYEESQFITQRWFLYSLGMGIPQTMKTMGIYKSFVLNPEASDVSDTFLGFFFRVLIVLQVETVAQYPLQRNQIREANIFWKPGFGYMGSSYFSLSLSSSAWFVLCIGRGRFSSDQAQLYRRGHRFPSLIIVYSRSIFASPINILQEKRCGFL